MIKILKNTWFVVFVILAVAGYCLGNFIFDFSSNTRTEIDQGVSVKINQRKNKNKILLRKKENEENINPKGGEKCGDGICDEVEKNNSKLCPEDCQDNSSGKNTVNFGNDISKKVIGVSNNEATYQNISYGPHEENIFDLWISESNRPTPLVIFIHGGGFLAGDKNKVFSKNSAGEMSDWKNQFLKDGISVASIDYRLIPNASMHEIFYEDFPRAIQYFRYNAEKYNIDKTKIGVIGPSAGGGGALWLGVHNDMADATNKELVLRESTKVQVVGHINSQSTYNLDKWKDIVGLPDDWKEIFNVAEKRNTSEDIDMVSYIDKNDAPIYLQNKNENRYPTEYGEIIHHPKHAIYLKSECDRVGLDCVLALKETNQDKLIKLVDFFEKYLK